MADERVDCYGTLKFFSKTLRKMSYFTNIKVFKIYSVIFDIHSHHTPRRNVSRLGHLYLCIYKQTLCAEGYSGTATIMSLQIEYNNEPKNVEFRMKCNVVILD